MVEARIEDAVACAWSLASGRLVSIVAPKGADAALTELRAVAAESARIGEIQRVAPGLYSKQHAAESDSWMNLKTARLLAFVSGAPSPGTLSNRLRQNRRV